MCSLIYPRFWMPLQKKSSPGLEVDFVLETVQILLRDHGISLSAETIIHSDYAEEKTIPKICPAA